MPTAGKYCFPSYLAGLPVACLPSHLQRAWGHISRSRTAVCCDSRIRSLSGGKEANMSISRLIAAASGLAFAFVAAPVTLLHSQVPAASDSGFQPWKPSSKVPVRATNTADSSFIREAYAGNVLE